MVYKMNKRTKKLSVLTNLALVLIFSAVLAVSFIPQSAVPIYGGNRVNAIYNGNRSKNNVSLMFNVYENTEIVNSIMDELKIYGAKCTFFVGGCWADDNEQALKRMVEEGHEIANHGYFHKDHKKLTYEQNKSEIVNTNAIIKAFSGSEVELFAPPSGSFSEVTLEACFDLDLKVIMWSKDTIDWRDRDVEKVYKRATNDLSNGDLVLMHPKEHTLKALPQILEFCNKSGFSVVTVSQNIGENNDSL